MRQATLLRMVAGLEAITGGTVEIGGKVVNDLKLRHPDIFVGTNFVYDEKLSTMQAVPDAAASESLHSLLPDVTDYLLTEALARRGGDNARLTHRDKLALVEALNAKGVFLMKGAVRHVADKLGVSQTTVYRYLNQIGAGPGQ